MNPPSGASTIYFYTARDAFRTEAQKRTDLAINYTRGVPGGPTINTLQYFPNAQVNNIYTYLQM